MPDQESDAMNAILLLALHGFFLKNPSRTAIDVEDLLSLNPPFPAGFILAIVDNLLEAGFLKKYNTAEDVGYGSAAYALTNRGLTAVSDLRASSTKEQIADASSSKATDTNFPVPASDRFVTRSDNVPLFEKAEQELEALTEAIRAANELKVTADERLAILSEVEGVRALVNQRVVRARAVYDATRDSAALGWLAKEASSGVVRALAAAAVTALLALIYL